MILRFVRNSVRHAAAATLVLLASLAFAPSHAEASCGDYVMVGGKHSAAGMNGSSHHDSHVPCHGPSCSNRSTPPLTPAPKVEIRVERWAIPGGSVSSPAPCSDFLLAEAHDLTCDGFGLSILRPPR